MRIPVEVYKARDTRLDRTVAINVLPEHVASNPDLKQRFEREARAVAALNHPHICTLYDIGRQEPSTELSKDYNVLASLAEEAEIGLSDFCREFTEVRAATEREKECRRCLGERRKSRSWTRSDLGRA